MAKATETAGAENRQGGVEVDPVTGQPTTGHVWDGIRELNRPLPRWWLWTFYGTIIWAAVYVVLYPAIPLISGATGGVLGYSTRATVEDALDQAREAQAGRLTQVADRSLDDISADRDLMRFAVAGGRSAYLVNCVQCHGSGAAGSSGYPNLNDDDWLWGGTLDAIAQTISFGVRSGNTDGHSSRMPVFGDFLSEADVASVADYVLSLSGQDHDTARAAEGAAVYANNCVFCHGESGEGSTDIGAPALNDAIALYGSSHDDIVAQVTKPRHGIMPAWADRLDPVVIKQLALYVYSLGGGEAAQN